MGCAASSRTIGDEGTVRGQQRADDSRATADRFECIEEVQTELRRAGLEACELIVAIDLTKSNEWSGESSFGGRSLHATSEGNNPYQSVLSIVAKTLSAFDDDQLIPTYGFGDATAKDYALLCFDPNGRPIHALENVLAAYNAVLPHIQLSGPTNFAPAIWKAIELVEESGGAFHVLVIIADGQVTAGKCQRETVRAIQAASNYALSIVMVGVGDGPWDKMEHYDDAIQFRKFDNFQFVNFTEIGERAAKHSYTTEEWEAAFALSALVEVPNQYRHINNLGMLMTKQARPIERISVVNVNSSFAAGSASFVATSQSMDNSLAQVAPHI